MTKPLYMQQIGRGLRQPKGPDVVIDLATVEKRMLALPGMEDAIRRRDRAAIDRIVADHARAIVKDEMHAQSYSGGLSRIRAEDK